MGKIGSVARAIRTVRSRLLVVSVESPPNSLSPHTHPTYTHIYTHIHTLSLSLRPYTMGSMIPSHSPFAMRTSRGSFTSTLSTTTMLVLLQLVLILVISPDLWHGQLAVVSATPAFAQKVLWLPLGDSITWGCTGGSIQDCHSDSGGYRLPLAFALSQTPLGRASNKGFDLSTMGTLSTGPSLLPAAWQRHEGHPGWQINTVDGILNKSLATSKTPPDLITIHLGTNDCNAGVNITAMVQRMDSLLGHIQAGAPKAQVYLSSVIATGQPWNTCIEAFNKEVPGIVSRWANHAQKPMAIK